MKKMRAVLATVIGISAAGFILAASLGHAQMTSNQIQPSNLRYLQVGDDAWLLSQLAYAQPVEPELAPEVGTFWSLQQLGKQPPLPFNPFAELPVYGLGHGQFIFDDSDVDYNALRRNRATDRSTTLEALDGEGDEPLDGPSPDMRRNFEKFMGHPFWLIDTNEVALDDTNLYSACVSFPEDINTAPTLQIKPYGENAVIIKANHFDYSTETNRDFALLICDSVDKPIWENVDLAGASSSQDGWLIQGLVSRFDVTDPMYLMVENISPDRNAFFRAIPYGGPQITLAGPQAYDVVSNTISFQVEITDLSGATNHQLTVLVNGLEPRYTLGPSNTITIDTRYTPNDFVTVAATVANFDAIVHNPTNPPMSRKLTFDNTATVPLVFENETYVYFPGDMSDPDIGTNYFLFGVTPPQYINATITEPSSGRILRNFSGYNPSYFYVRLSWNFTEADGATPYTNDEYIVTFTASNSPAGGGTTLTITNTIERSGVRPAGWVISNYEEVRPSKNQGWGSWVNSQMQTWWNAVAFMYETLYAWQFASQTQYYPWQIGSNRNTPTSPKMPFVLNPSTEASWPQFVRECVTNRSYSDFNFMGHGNGWMIGGGEFSIPWLNYVNRTITSQDMQDWVLTGSRADKRWRMRKIALWACWSARRGAYSSWYEAFGIRPRQMNTLSGKNAGLFFNEDLEFVRYKDKATGTLYFYGDPPASVAEVAAFFDKIWVMGAYPWPGGADPNYSIQFAFNVARGVFNPAFDMAGPVLIGCPYLPFAGVYDDELMKNDFHQVKP